AAHLTPGAEHAGATAQDDAGQARAAPRTWLPRAAVDEERVGAGVRVSLAVREFARDREPHAAGDRARVGGKEQGVARGSRIDARDPQALRRQDVADTGEDALVHDDLLHRA